MHDELRYKTRNAKIDHAFSFGHKAGVDWLRGDYHSQDDRAMRLLADLKELRAMYLAAVPDRPLTIREAQLLKVCRVCRQDDRGGPFLFNFGEEYAHVACLPGKS